jgi:hypothetical protein
MLSIPQIESKIRHHWTEWLPNRVAELKETGMWEHRVRKTAEQAHKMMRNLMDQGYPDWAAEEVALKELVLLPPEENPEDEEEAELAEMEREYQRDQAELERKVRERDEAADREWEKAYLARQAQAGHPNLTED